ncbi:flagellar hook protein FlgE [Natronohydrobacter thiooxidans]|uniref:flagellar hook protein FlgE n=1 Tax=Natronohydrobacter thiooxidans TaxID=87172 RepID=UPI0008FF1F69|nr:flagellar hook-basal body complex protein [Natronohydrobacter thiooxidans]
MSISSSMNAGVAGLRANATRLATISDNIANSATYGYRRANTSFHSMVVGSGVAGQGEYAAGGVRTTSQRLVDQGGSLIGTQHATDIAISGRGFLPVTTDLGARLQDGTAPLLLTTTGSFRQDSQGYMRDSAGNTLLGWPANPDGTIPVFPRDSIAGLRPIQIAVNQQSFLATTNIRFGVNLPASATLPTASGEPYRMLVEYFNELGLSQTIDVEMTPSLTPPTASNRWQLQLTHAQSGDVLGSYEIVFDDAPGRGGTLLSVDRTSAEGGDYDPATGQMLIEADGQQIGFAIGRIGEGGGIVQRGATFSPAGVEQNGFGAGNLVGLMVDTNGNLDAVYDQGFRRTLFRIPIVDVPNPNGLTARNAQAFQVSRDSGPFFLWDAGDGPVGEFVGFALQESATDVAAELTGLIQTQRAYSSNAKVIQTVDEMFQETTNIKR